MKKFIWFLLGKCEYCGGELKDWSVKKSFCKQCNKKQ